MKIAATPIRLLAQPPNEKGDLFARLVADLLLSQGYENPRMNVHKTGREIDLKARHRLEDKIAIAECKASRHPIGGDDLNKFAGVLERERDNSGHAAVQGYFISLSGFRESAREQEEEGTGPRFVLIDGEGVRDQLVAGGMVASPEAACEAAGRLASEHGLDSKLIGAPQLLAHALGWIWLCLLGTNHEVTQFALVHADGRPIGPSAARGIIEEDQREGGTLNELIFIAPKSDADGQGAIAQAEDKYKAYLQNELGVFTLEGLPADEEVGARHIALEDLYVPLHIEPAVGERQKPQDTTHSEVSFHFRDGQTDTESADEGKQREKIGTVLNRTQRLAVLAAPGAGKTTLIKHLAVAYSDSSSTEDSDLPNVDWLPIFIRCRTLGQVARQPIWNALDEIPNRGEFPEHAKGFHHLVAGALREGRALLLIDGLDEISDQGDRLAFVRQLRTFLGTYPSAALILTSRERGFRAVAGAMSSMCEWYRLADFNDDDIRSLTQAWHETVVGKTEKIVHDSDALASTIIATDRVKRLARNPLLLTTLLLVKRWVGELPRRRTVLYEKAIEVLLMTWNVEAHEPIDREEAIPQLAFVAHAMTSQGVQSLSSATLTKLLAEAREQMPEILGFAQTSVSHFVAQVESRSSLLVMTGHVEEQGTLVPNYEFRHLTFQEYLTAVALVEGYYQGHRDEDTLVAELAPHFEDPEWLEVISLANVRAGRGASAVVSELLQRLDTANNEDLRDDHQLEAELLARALADEVQLPPPLVQSVSQVVGRAKRAAFRIELLREIVGGRYGGMFREVIEKRYHEDADPTFAEYGGTYASLLMLSEGENTFEALGDEIGTLLSSDDEQAATRGCLKAMELAFGGFVDSQDRDDVAEMATRGQWASKAVAHAESGRPFVGYAAAWAVVWLGEIDAVDPQEAGRALRAMVELWRRSSAVLVKKQAAWACTALPEIDRADSPLGPATPKLCRFIEDEAKAGEEEDSWREDRGSASLLLAYYLKAPWDDEELARRAKNFSRGKSSVLHRLHEAEASPEEPPF